MLRADAQLMAATGCRAADYPDLGRLQPSSYLQLPALTGAEPHIAEGWQ